MAKVFVVDDNANYRKVIATVLGCEGHAILEAADGADAFEFALKEPPQVRFGDQHLVAHPARDGRRQ
jgi:CheY-like chemotaxis protein